MRPILTRTNNGNYYSEEDPGERGYKNNPKRLSVTDGEARILRGLSYNFRILEIGTGLGVSTRAMAETAKEVVSVDIDSWAHQFDFPDNVKLVNEIPLDKFDLVFIDGSHKYQNVVADINIVNASILVLHDCFIPDVQRAIKDTDLRELKKFNTACDMRMFKK